MSLHLKKICVGPVSLDAYLESLKGRDVLRIHTRQRPRRDAELLDAGSLYWIIAGQFAVRHRIWDLSDAQHPNSGIACVAVTLDPAPIPLVPRAHGPFQGWRYLKSADAPPDLEAQPSHAVLPPHIYQALAKDLAL